MSFLQRIDDNPPNYDDICEEKVSTAPEEEVDPDDDLSFIKEVIMDSLTIKQDEIRLRDNEVFKYHTMLKARDYKDIMFHEVFACTHTEGSFDSKRYCNTNKISLNIMLSTYDDHDTINLIFSDNIGNVFFMSFSNKYKLNSKYIINRRKPDMAKLKKLLNYRLGLDYISKDILTGNPCYHNDTSTTTTEKESIRIRSDTKHMFGQYFEFTKIGVGVTTVLLVIPCGIALLTGTYVPLFIFFAPLLFISLGAPYPMYAVYREIKHKFRTFKKRFKKIK